MPDSKTPEALDDTTLDDISGGPTEELFGAYNFSVSDSTGYVGETEKNVWKAPAGLKAGIRTRKR